MLRRLAEKPSLIFGFVFAFKVALLVFTTQPVPANDAFFYDGPVVNYLLNGKYTNPSLALTLPISGHRIFSAYPPLYQFVLAGWMSLLGTSALAAMWFHLLLFGAYMLTLHAMMRRLPVPVWAIHVAGAFLLAIPSHDRPDSLGHLLGILGIYTLIRAKLPSGDATRRCNWCSWIAVGLGLLSFFSGPVIGAFYLSIIGALIAANAWVTKDGFALVPIAGIVAVPPVVICAIAAGRPDLWAGFMEHARQTPSLSQVHVPRFFQIIKIVRTTPGILAVAAYAPVLFLRMKRSKMVGDTRTGLVGLVALLATLGIIAACMVLLTANLVHATAYLQPLVVGCFLAYFAPLFQIRRQHIIATAFWLLAIFAGIRSIGQATWGVACAMDVNYAEAINIVRRETDSVPDGQPVIYSSAYLYEAAHHKNVNWIHSDWLGPMKRGEGLSFPDAVVQLKPAKLILTQFDYYRRYDTVVAELKSRPELADVKIFDAVKTRPPDSYPSLQRVTQHLSWAPIVVTLTWKSAPP